MRCQWILGIAVYALLAACGDSSVALLDYEEPRVILTPPLVEIQPGHTAKVVVTYIDSKGRHRIDPPVTWASSDTAVVRVSGDGVVVGLRPGTALLTASVDGFSGTVVVRVVGVASAGWTVQLGRDRFAPLHDIWGASATDIFAVGVGTYGDCCASILHYDGRAWSAMSVPETARGLLGVWGSSSSDVYAVGVGGAVLHYDGASWSSSTVSTETLYGVWGSSATDVFAVGAVGTVLHYDGAAWTRMSVPATWSRATVRSVWGSSARDVFAVCDTGRVGAILHFDGSRWSAMNLPPVPALRDIWGAGGTDVYAVGDETVILHYDGVAWSVVSGPYSNAWALPLLGVWGRSGSDVYAVGGIDEYSCCDIKLHWDGGSWARMDEPPAISPGLEQWYGEALRAVWGTDAGLFVVGTGPTILYRER